MPSLTLFIDLCSHRKIVACLDEEKTIAFADIPDHTDEADLMPAIERLMRSAGFSVQGLGRIAAITGPGGFMSQRVELSLANTLAWTLKIPIAGIHLSDFWFARTAEFPTPIPNPHPCIWLHSTQKSALFIRGFGEATNRWPEAMLIALEEAKKIPKEHPIVGELIPEHRDFFSPVPDETLQSIERVLPELCEKASYGQPPILPWYGRGI